VSRFVKTDRGFVNLDHVAVIRRLRLQESAGQREVICRFIGAREELLGETKSGGYGDLDGVLGELVPAAAGSYAYLVTVASADENERPSDVWCQRSPIIAWHIEIFFGSKLVEPVFAMQPAKDEIVILPCGDGRMMIPDGFAVYDDLEAAKTSLLEDAQASWDSRQAANPPVQKTAQQRLAAMRRQQPEE
jgi:hypothetical protein